MGYCSWSYQSKHNIVVFLLSLLQTNFFYKDFACCKLTASNFLKQNPGSNVVKNPVTILVNLKIDFSTNAVKSRRYFQTWTNLMTHNKKDVNQTDRKKKVTTLWKTCLVSLRISRISRKINKRTVINTRRGQLRSSDY